MKKLYETPDVRLIYIDQDDIITSSPAQPERDYVDDPFYDTEW